MDQKQQIALVEIKNRLLKPPTLHYPDNKGRFQVFSDTRKTAAGSALYQILPPN